jgi:hypothetical protein
MIALQTDCKWNKLLVQLLQSKLQRMEQTAYAAISSSGKIWQVLKW